MSQLPKPIWKKVLPTRRILVFPSGAQAFLYSAARPDSLRGPQHHFAWCDEPAIAAPIPPGTI